MTTKAVSAPKRVLVTGAAGFLGQALARALADEQRGAVGGDALQLILTDRAPANQTPPLVPARWIIGDIADPLLIERLFADPLDCVFHLAAVVSGAAEADFELGKHVNLDATLALLERCRRQAQGGAALPRFIYASSIAVFGVPLPTRIDDATAPAPTLSYGTHKRACELLIDDYTRRGFIDGRALRLSGVVVRPALPNGALSGFNSDLIREPLAGRDYVCPVSLDAGIWITSLHSTVANLIAMARIDAASLGPQRAVTAPALALSVAEVIAAIARAYARAAARISHQPRPEIETQFGRWPADCAFDRAMALGLRKDGSIDELIERCAAGMKEPAP